MSFYDVFAGDQVGALAGERDPGLEQGRAGDDEAAEMTPFFSSSSPTSPTLEPFGIFTATRPLAVAVEGLEEGVEEEQDHDQDDHGEDPERVAQQRAGGPAAAATVFAMAATVRGPPRPSPDRPRRGSLPVVDERRRRLPSPPPVSSTAPAAAPTRGCPGSARRSARRRTAGGVGSRLRARPRRELDARRSARLFAGRRLVVTG